MTVRSMYVYNGSSWDEVGYTIAHGVPAGGASSAILSKSSATDYDTAWVAAEGWVTPIRTSGGYVAKTALYTATNDDRVINCTSGTYTITLPTAVSQAGREFVINNSGSGVITVDGAGSETVAGAATQALSGRGRLRIVSDGSNWVVIDGSYADESVGRRLFQWDANNSRWQQTFGDTGWRAVTDLLLNGWLTAADRITIRRQNNVVTLMLGDMDGRSATTDVIMTLPSGFRPNWQYNVPSYTTSGATSSRSVNAVYTGNVTWCGTPRPTYENAIFTYLTSDAWPTTLPGTASGSIPA